MASVASAGVSPEKTAIPILLAASFCHMLNDIMQALLTSLYPLLKANYALDFAQIGLLTFAFQVTASFLQPVVGVVTDRWPMPFSSPVAMLSTAAGLLTLAHAHSFPILVLGACLIGLGSAIFHPEASRVARLASGGRYGLAQSLFQVGGNAGSAIGPLLAAFIVIPRGQESLSWFALIALAGFAILAWTGVWHSRHRRSNAGRPPVSRALPLPRGKVMMTLAVLVVLVATKNSYLASLSSYFTFYTMDKFGLDIQDAQVLLFLFLGASAVGVFFGGPIGDRFGSRFVIWFSILGVIPFALLLPYATLFWTAALVVAIGFVFSSAFSAIVVFAQELAPGRVGLIAGLFFGLAFGFGGLGAAVLGILADREGIAFVYRVCSYLPLLGLLTLLLPRLPGRGEPSGLHPGAGPARAAHQAQRVLPGGGGRGDHTAAARQVAAVRIGRRPAARLAHDQQPREAVPGVHVRLQVGREPARRHIGEHQRARPVAKEHPAHPRQVARHLGDPLGRGAMARPHPGRGALDAQAWPEMQRHAVQRRAGAQSGREPLAMSRRVDHPDHRVQTLRHRHGDAPVRHPEKVGRGAVDRIDHPGVAGSPLRQAVFLAKEAVLREDRRHAVAHQPLDAAVGLGDDVEQRSLRLDRQSLALAPEVERETAGLGPHAPRQGGARLDLGHGELLG